MRETASTYVMRTLLTAALWLALLEMAAGIVLRLH
jgi:hypothetical protein